MNRFARTTVVSLLVLFAVSTVYGTASALWQPQGTFGLSTDYGANVRAVELDSPAAAEGVVAGDTILLRTMPWNERRFVAGVGARFAPGMSVRFVLRHQGVDRTVSLTAVRAVVNSGDRFSLLFQCAASVVFIAVGASLIVLRTSRATWGFGLYCLLVLPTADNPFPLPSGVAALIALGLYDVLQNVGVVGLLVFALEFPRPFNEPWREVVRRALPAIFVVLAAMTLYPDVANLIVGTGAQIENHLLQVAFGAVFVLALVILLDSYRHISAEERERVRWVTIGFSLGLIASYVGSTFIYSSVFPFEPPVWLSSLFVSINVLLPLTVAHAVVRHRVLDVDFVIGRALIYAVLTTILAGVFGLLDWFFGHVLEEIRLTTLVQAAISITIAFTFDALHKRTERIIEVVFFRKRQAAEEHLTRLARELPQSRSEQIVERAVVSEAVDAFELTSAALYRLADRNEFLRTSSFGWEDHECRSLDDDDFLVLTLRDRNGVVTLRDMPWQRPDLPRGARGPLIAIPMKTRAELTAIVLYGGHPAGADIDPDESACLERLAHAAGVAFDELESERLRDANALQLAKLDEFAARLDEARRTLSATLRPAT